MALDPGFQARVKPTAEKLESDSIVVSEKLVNEIVYSLKPPMIGFDDNRGYLELPTYYHPWDKTKPAEQSVRLDLVSELAKTVGVFSQTKPLDTDWFAVLVLQRLADRLNEELFLLANRDCPVQAQAAQALWEIARASIERLDKLPPKTLVGFTASKLKLPAMIGLPDEDVEKVGQRQKDLGLATSAIVPRDRWKQSKPGRKCSPSTPTNTLAHSLVEFMDSIRKMKYQASKDHISDWNRKHGKTLFSRIRKLPPLDREKSVIMRWLECSTEILETRYGSLMDIKEVSSLGEGRLRRFGRKRDAAGDIKKALRESLERLAVGQPFHQ